MNTQPKPNTQHPPMATESTSRVPPARMRACEQTLEALVKDNPDILSALVATVDGFSVAQAPRGPASDGRMAAMISSLHALGTAVTSQADLGDCEDVLVEASNGRLLLIEISSVRPSLLLGVLARANAPLGVVLYASRQAAAALTAASLHAV
jgi:uncharacterized protein